MASPESIVAAFEDCTLPPERFGHREHLLVAWAYLRALPYFDAAARFAANLRRYAAAHGASGKWHATITFAWLAILAERMHADGGLGGRESPEPGDGAAEFDALVARHPDLLGRGALLAHYDERTLASPLAREVFLLPRPRA